MNIVDRFRAILRGGAVRRYHIEPLVGVQTVAEHTWRAVQLLLQANPNAERQLILAVLHHDVPEGMVGDLSYQTKRAYPLLREQLEEAEAEVMASLGLEMGLSGGEQLWLSWVDRAEALWFSLDQLKLGNHEARVWFRRSWPEVVGVLSALQRAEENVYYAQRLLDGLTTEWFELTDEDYPPFFEDLTTEIALS